MDDVLMAWEWTRGQYWPYPYDGDDGRDDPEGGAERVIRGGSWAKPALRARTVSRGMNDPFFTDNDVGFRCVRTYAAFLSSVSISFSLTGA